MTADHDRALGRGFCDPASGEPTRTHPEVARIARSLVETPPRERGSIISTLNQFLAVWGDELVTASTAASDVSLRRLAARDEPMSLYISIPFDDLARLGPLVRILLALLTLAVTEEHEGADAALSGRRPLLLVLDEFAALGRVPILEQMLAFLRGYGVTAMIVLQDLNQLRRLYSDRESISGTCQIHVVGATQNTETRRHASRLAGEATVRFEHRSVSGGRHSPLKPRATVTDAETRRPLVTEGEVGTLPADRLLVFKTGLPPILAWKHPYFRDPRLADRAAIPPPAESTERPSSRQTRAILPPAPSASGPIPPGRLVRHSEAEVELEAGR
jgi:type IV secretion system protein VirD4